MLKIKLFLTTRVNSKRALSSHFSGGIPEPLPSWEVRRICDDINYVLLQVDIIELCSVNLYTVLKLTNKYSLIIIIIIIIIIIMFIFTPIRFSPVRNPQF
jgi:hypothetical protein